jgi:hypothetical protein
MYLNYMHTAQNLYLSLDIYDEVAVCTRTFGNYALKEINYLHNYKHIHSASPSLSIYSTYIEVFKIKVSIWVLSRTSSPLYPIFHFRQVP